jgi:ATP-binding cassette subfamily F protein 3
MDLEIMEKRLAEEALYTDPDRREELTDLVRRQGELRAGVEDLEWEWLEVSEALEQARTGEGES